MEAIEESKSAILSQDDLPPPPKTATVVGVDGMMLSLYVKFIEAIIALGRLAPEFFASVVRPY